MRILYIPSGQYIKVWAEDGGITEIIETAIGALGFLENRTIEELGELIISYFLNKMFSGINRINGFERDMDFLETEFEIVDLEK